MSKFFILALLICSTFLVADDVMLAKLLRGGTEFRATRIREDPIKEAEENAPLVTKDNYEEDEDEEEVEEEDDF